MKSFKADLTCIVIVQALYIDVWKCVNISITSFVATNLTLFLAFA